jgi:MOSC domain-containing protein YiiM
MLVESVNVGAIREVSFRGRTVTTSIWKQPVDGPVRASGVNLAGDDQADRSVHGGRDKAIYAYAAEDIEYWEAELDRPLGPGAFGENLTVRGVDLNESRVGERWHVGSTVLEVRQPRVPCFKLGIRMGDSRFPAAFARAGRTGAYLAIVEAGDIRAGDAIEVGERPSHDVTVGLIADAYFNDHTLSGDLLAAAALPGEWRRWAIAHVASP